MIITKFSYLIACAVLASGTVIAQSSLSDLNRWNTSTGIAGYRYPQGIDVSPGQVITIFVDGLTTSGANATAVPLPTSLAGIAVLAEVPGGVYSAYLPIFYVDRLGTGGKAGRYLDLTAISLQIPTEIARSVPDAPIAPYYLLITVFENGVKKHQAEFHVVPFNAHLLHTCDTVTRVGGACFWMVTHGDGRLVTPQNPAVAGEGVTIWAVGLGRTTPVVPTGAAAASPALVERPDRFTAEFEFFECNGCSNPPVSLPASKPLFAGLAPNFVGLYQVNIKLPDQIPASRYPCAGTQDGVNLAIRIGWDSIGLPPSVFSDPALICVQTQTMN